MTKKSTHKISRLFIAISVTLLPLSLAGCDYWPPALLTQLEQLRIHVQDLSDERAELEARLHQALISQEELQEQVQDLSRQNETLRHSITNLKQVQSQQRVKARQLAKAQPIRKRGVKTSRKKNARVLSYSRPLMKGKDVRTVQRNLRKLGIPVRVDGVFGADTRSAIKWFQRKHRLRVDGAVGPSTNRHLFKQLERTSLRKTVRLKRPFMTGPRITSIQRALRKAGVSVRVDGAFGHGTRSAVKRFQRTQGLRVDGVVGPATRQALGLS